MKKSLILIIVLAVIGLIAGLFAKKTQEKPFTYETKTVSIAGEKGDWTVDQKYPLVSTGLNKRVREDINGAIEFRMNEILEEGRKSFDDISAELEDLPAAPEWKMTQSTDYVFVYDPLSSPLINIILETYSYTGGAHGVTVTESLVFDTVTGRRIFLADVFTGDYLNALSQLALEEIRKKDPKLETYLFAEEGTQADEKNFKSFVIEKDGIRFYFDDYQVGPYAAGKLDVLLPYSGLSAVLKPDCCIKKQ